jgi:hypothetical protein
MLLHRADIAVSRAGPVLDLPSLGNARAWLVEVTPEADIELAHYEEGSIHPRDKVDYKYNRKNFMIPLVLCLDSYNTGDYLTGIVDKVFRSQASKMIGALRISINKIPKPNCYE